MAAPAGQNPAPAHPIAYGAQGIWLQETEATDVFLSAKEQADAALAVELRAQGQDRGPRRAL